MRIDVCYMCSGPIYPGHGIQFARNDCKIFKFCRSKCHRHFKAKHNPQKLKWTKAYRKLHGKEMIKDSAFEFEKKRNELQTYNREDYINTIQSMKVIDQIQLKRKVIFKKNKQQISQRKQLKSDQNLLINHENLLKDKTLLNEIKNTKNQEQQQKQKQLN